MLIFRNNLQNASLSYIRKEIADKKGQLIHHIKDSDQALIAVALDLVSFSSVKYT